MDSEPPMDVCFASPSLQRECNQLTALVARWGADGARSIGRALEELAALDHLGEIAELPHIRLVGGLPGPIVISCADGADVTLEANNRHGAQPTRLDEVGEVVVLDVAIARPATTGRLSG